MGAGGVRRFGAASWWRLFFAGGLLGVFRLRARYFCVRTKVPKKRLRNLRFLRTSLCGDLMPAFLPIRRSWSNTRFSRVLSHLGNSRLSFLPTGTAGPGWWGRGCGPMGTSAPTTLGPSAWRATTRRALEAGQAGGASPSPTRMIRNMARRGAHCAPVVELGMTRENPSRRPAGGGCQSVPKGPGAASIGGLSCFLLRCAGQFFQGPFQRPPYQIGGPGEGSVRTEGGCAAWKSAYCPPPAAFSPIFGRSKMGPRPPSFVPRLPSPVK